MTIGFPRRERLAETALIVVCCCGLRPATGQPFADIGAPLIGVHQCSVGWGDYDNDGDLDLVLAGANLESGALPVTKIYRNDAGTFVDIGASITEVRGRPSVAWGDYDNDGDLDLAFSGWTGSAYISRIYRNDAGAFVNINAGLVGVDHGMLAWGDYDNDGDLDLLVTGDQSGTAMTRLYRNDGSGTPGFTDVPTSLPPLNADSWVTWADYDNDGDLDLGLAGQTDIGAISRIYRNDGGPGGPVFTDIEAGLTGVVFGSLAWGDYDNDGDLDLALAGRTNTSLRITKIYRNDSGPGGPVFTDIGVSLPPIYYAGLSWGDYDNDGDLDLALTGDFNLIPTSKIYRNDDPGGPVFTDIAAGLMGVRWGTCVQWGDYDADGDFDLALAGYTGSTFISQIYRNDGGNVNTAPTPPNGLSYSVENGKVTLRWNASSDNQTPALGLSYNVRVGTGPGAQDVLTGMADPSTGLRRIPALGNAQMILSRILSSLAYDTYYWSVQAIDTAFAGSGWSAEGTFTLTPADLDGDGDVDVKDFLTFSACFNGALNPPRPTCANAGADLDGDGDVDGDDFLTFSNCFNGSLSPPRCVE